MKYFSSLDMDSGYWQVYMDNESREKTAFVTHIGLFEFNVMSFGLTNAPATFERMVENMIQGLRWNKALVYLDDIIIFGADFKSARKNLRQILGRIREFGLKLKAKKCSLFKTSVKFLGRIIGQDGVRPDPDKIEAVISWPTPSCVRDVRSFLGLVSYYREFLNEMAEIAEPMYSKLRGDLTKFTWDTADQEAFEKLKKLLTSAPILGYPREVGQYLVDSDASNFSTGGVLSQVQEEREVVIAYYSRSLKHSERNFCVTQRELLGVIKNLQKFKHFIWGNDYLIRTDHSSLRWILNFKDADGKLARWLAILAYYEVTHKNIIHRPGRLHLNADALSRIIITRPCKNPDCTNCQPILQVCALNLLIKGVEAQCWDRLEWVTLQTKDPVLSEVRSKVLSGKGGRVIDPADSPAVREYEPHLPEIQIRDGLLILVPKPKEVYGEDRILVPSEVKATIFTMCHEHIAGGHLGVKRTYTLAERDYFWPGMREELRLWVRKCEKCLQVKSYPGEGKMALHKELTLMRFERVALDIAPGVPLTPRGNTCIVVIEDYFTKFVVALPLPNYKADTCAVALVDHWILKFGLMRYLHSDRGQNFMSNLWKQMNELLGIKKTFTNPYTPRSDGLVERQNRTMKQLLTCYVNQRRDDWDLLLPYVVFAYNNSRHESTGYSPNELIFGQNLVSFPSQYAKRLETEKEKICYYGLVEAIQEYFTTANEIVQRNLIRTVAPQEKAYNTNLKPRSYSLGQLVYRKMMPKPSLAKAWEGPYKITKIWNDWTYQLKHLHNGHRATVNVNFLKPCPLETLDKLDEGRESIDEHDTLHFRSKDKKEEGQSFSEPGTKDGQLSPGSEVQGHGSPQANSPAGDNPIVFTKTRRVKPPDRYGF